MRAFDMLAHLHVCLALPVRWLNQLRPNVQTGSFTPDEDQVRLHACMHVEDQWGAAWCLMQKPGATLNSTSA